MKKSNPYTAEERETIVNFSDADGSAEVYTASCYVIQKLDKLCKEYPEHYKCINSDDWSKTYSVSSKKLIRFAKPSKPLTDEQKAAAVARLAKYSKKD